MHARASAGAAKGDRPSRQCAVRAAARGSSPSPAAVPRREFQSSRLDRRPCSSAPAVSSAVEAPSSTSAQDAPPVLPYRVGHGFDLHRLAEGYPLIIGGITIPHTKGCEAHSDGDVLLHCIVDAINGALSLPDIGQMFPDNDPKWKGAASHIFIAESVRLMRERGYVIGNLDATLIAQKPKLSPHKVAIRDNLCRLLDAHPSVINIKAKTHEKVDSIGEERSIACHTVVMLIKEDLIA